MKILIEISESQFADIQRIASVQLKNRLPTVEQIVASGTQQLEELIRCKNCKHWEGEKRGQFWYFEQCSLNQHVASCDDFCSFAERKEGD